MHSLLYALCVVAAPAAVAALDWVSVDSSGRAVATYTAATTGASTTVPAPPRHLTSTAAHVLLLPEDGDGDTATRAAIATATATTTTTGLPPVASAVGPGSAGAFLLCHSDGDGDGDDSSSRNYLGTPEDSASPFCQPADGSQVEPGGVYYITWDPTYFDPGTQVTVAATYSNGDGFLAATPVDGAAGFYAWVLAASFLQDLQVDGAGNGDGDDNARLAVTWSLLYNGSTAATGRTARVMVGGPTVVVTARPVTAASRHKKVPVAAVAVPVVVVGVALLAALVGCVCAYRHTGRLPLVGGLVARRTSSFSAKGYPAKGYPAKGYPAGGGGRAAGVPDPVSVAPPRRPPGVNVFREELKRQEEERK